MLNPSDFEIILLRRADRGRRIFLQLGPPSRKVICVERDAKKIGGNKAELGRADPDEAKNDAI